MIARINTGAKPAGAVYYNEYKVAHGEARYLGGFNAIPYERNALSVEKKIDVLEMYAAGNPRISKPTFHVSLAFHPDEKLSDERLTEIGQQYMERLGYNHQPYLIYRHEDTHHPHIHIVSISVDADGNRISDSHQQRRSNAIRQALEKEYGLIEAEKQGKEVLISGLLPEEVLTYKEPEAKKAIGNVVRTALTDYHFSNMQIFSQFLHQHRVQMNQIEGTTADGKSYRGISFQLYCGQNDQRGEVIGPAIKASRFAFAPTYDRLESKFKQNAPRIRNGKDATRQRIHSSLGSYSQLSETDFKAQLRSAGIQVIDTGKQYVYVDHKNRNVYAENELGTAYTRSIQQAAFSEKSVSLTTAPNRVQTTSSRDDDQPRTSQSVEPSQQTEKPTPAREPTVQQLTLRKRVSHFYQQVRQHGFQGNKPYFFESQLIRHFPHEPLTNLLIGEGVSSQAARLAVTQFEAYKQSQLPDIRAKEEAYFSQTARQFATLAGGLPLATTSKRAFLEAADFVLSVDQATLTHREDAQLRYAIPASVQQQLKQDQGTALAFRNRLTKPERSLYGALASGQTPPDSVSFYQLSAAHLKAATGPLFDRISYPLNHSYANQVSQRLTDEQPLLAQLQARGLVIDALASGAYRMGHYLTHSDQFIPVPDALARRLQNESLPALPEQTETLLSPAGRSLIAIRQALDGNNTALIKAELSRWARQLNHPLGTGSIIDQALGVQAQLQAQLTAKKGIGSTRQPVTAQPVSSLSQGLVRLLQESSVSAQQRYQIIAQLDVVWHHSTSGQWQLKEGPNSPYPGHVYTLTSAEQAAFSQPSSNEPLNIRLNEADQALIRAISQGNDLSSLNRQQVANLTLPVWETILPKEMVAAFQCRYNEQRGNQILHNTQRQFGEQATARRYLSALYQRGLLVKQAVDASNKPVYRMGHYKTNPANYVVVPPTLAQVFNRQFPNEFRKDAYVLEGAWPAPNSVAAQRMRALAMAIDSEAEPGRVNKLIGRIYERFPHLSDVQDPQLLLDRLVSQPRMNQLSVRNLTSSPQPSAANSQHFTSSSHSSTRKESSSDSLHVLLERFEKQAPQKGLLDILGESASVIRPRKKRIEPSARTKRIKR